MYNDNNDLSFFPHFKTSENIKPKANNEGVERNNGTRAVT